MWHISLINWHTFNMTASPQWTPSSHAHYSHRHTPSDVCVPHNQVAVRQKCLWHRCSRQNHQTSGGNYSLYSDHPGAQPQSTPGAALQRVRVLSREPSAKRQLQVTVTSRGETWRSSQASTADIPKSGPCNQNIPTELYFRRNVCVGAANIFSTYSLGGPAFPTLVWESTGEQPAAKIHASKLPRTFPASLVVVPQDHVLAKHMWGDTVCAASESCPVTQAGGRLRNAKQ